MVLGVVGPFGDPLGLHFLLVDCMLISDRFGVPKLEDANKVGGEGLVDDIFVALSNVIFCIVCWASECRESISSELFNQLTAIPEIFFFGWMIVNVTVKILDTFQVRTSLLRTLAIHWR